MLLQMKVKTVKHRTWEGLLPGAVPSLTVHRDSGAIGISFDTAISCVTRFIHISVKYTKRYFTKIERWKLHELYLGGSIQGEAPRILLFSGKGCKVDGAYLVSRVSIIQFNPKHWEKQRRVVRHGSSFCLGSSIYRDQQKSTWLNGYAMKCTYRNEGKKKTDKLFFLYSLHDKKWIYARLFHRHCM